VKLVLGSDDNCLHCFVENLFNKQSAKFIQNRPSFMKVMVKQILVCFLCPTDYVYTRLYAAKPRHDALEAAGSQGRGRGLPKPRGWPRQRVRRVAAGHTDAGTYVPQLI